MTGFLYYFPGKTNVTPADLQAAGLGHAFEAACGRTPNEANGPNGGRGVILTDSRRVHPGLNKYAPDQQAWEQHATAGYWVGMYKSDRPTPEALERDRKIAGTKVVLGDGNEWIVPTGVRWSMEDDPTTWTRDDVIPRWQVALPQVVRFVTDATAPQEGAMGGVSHSYDRVQPDCAELWALTDAYMQLKYGIASESVAKAFEGTNLYLNTIRVVQANYAVGMLESNLLGLLVSGVPTKVFEALGDWHAWEELTEKKRSALLAGLPSSNGHGETPLAIDPPALTSSL